MIENTKVTIVTVTYNAEDLLEETIRSVVNQSYENIEYIIIDGASTDGTIDIIKKYEDKIDYWISEPDDGIYYAMNKAIKIASGEFINFMNAGDTFFDVNTVKQIIKNRNNNVEFIYGDFVKKQSLIYKTARPRDEWYKGMPFCHQTLFATTQLMNKYKFDTSFQLAADHDFILRMHRQNRNFQYIPKAIVMFDENGFAQANKFLMSIESLYILLKYDFSIGEVRKSWWFKVLKSIVNDNPKVVKPTLKQTNLYKLLYKVAKITINKYHKYKQTIHQFYKLKEKKKKRKHLNNKYTIVSAVYNVEKYLDEFISSIVNQEGGFEKNIFLILVDDGSTDNSANIIKKWQNKFSDNIQYFKKENGGQSSARNLGIDHVNTPWVTFMDPDDFVSKNYFYEIDSFISRKENNSISCVSCNLIFHMENDRSFRNHYLSYRFKEKEKVVNPHAMQNFIQTTANSVILKTDLIIQNKLLFNEKIKPAYEDGDFINRYFMENDQIDIAFLSQPKYYYRKRSDGTSTLDTAWFKPQRYTDAIEFGLLQLLKDANDKYGYVPVYIQRYVLYHLSYYFNKIVFKNFILDFLSYREEKKFYKLLDQVFFFIEINTIIQANLGAMNHKLKLGLLSIYKNSEFTENQVYYIDEYNENTGLLKIRFYNHSGNVLEIFKLNSEILDLKDVNTKCYFFNNQRFIDEIIVELSVNGHWEYLNIELKEYKNIQISFKKKKYNNAIQVAKLKGYI